MPKWDVMAIITVEATDDRAAIAKAEEVAEFCKARGPMDAVTPVQIEVIDDPAPGLFCPELADED
jgi:hypothetical protein